MTEGVAGEEEGVAGEEGRGSGDAQETTRSWFFNRNLKYLMSKFFVLCFVRVVIPKLIRPIFDWSEVNDYFKPCTQQVDYTFLTQVSLEQVSIIRRVLLIL